MPIKATFTGDVTDLRRGTEQARQEFRKVGTEAEGAARQLKAVGSSFDGSRLEGAARRAATSIERIGGVSRLTDSEIAKNSRTISELLQKYERMGVEAPANIRRLANELEQAAGAARKLETASSGLGSSLKSGLGALAGGLGIGLGAGAGLAVLTSIGGAIREIAAEGARMGPLAQAFERLQGGAGLAQQALVAMRTATRGLVSDTDLMRSSNQATQLGLAGLGVDFSTLAQAAVTLGSAVGNDATQSIDDLVGALGRGSTEVLDNLGITLRVSEAQEIYAARLGKTTEKLTDQEKKQAFVTIAMERAAEKAAALGVQQLTVGQQVERIGTAVGDMAVQLATGADKSTTLATALGTVADALDRIRNAKPGETADILAADMARASRDIEQSIERTINNLPWYLRALAEIGAAPIRLSNLAVGSVVPAMVGNTSGVSLATTRPQPSHLVPVAPLPSHGGPATPPVVPPGPTTEQAAALKKWREEIDRITGAATIAAAERLAKQINQVGGSRIPIQNAKALSDQLREAMEMARGLGRTISQDVVEAFRQLPIEVGRIGGAGTVWGLAPAITDAVHEILPQRGAPWTGQLIGLMPAVTDNMTGGVLDGTKPVVKATKDWRIELEGVARAFAQLATVAGPALQKISGTVGTLFAGASAGREMVNALSSVATGLTQYKTDEHGQIVYDAHGKPIVEFSPAGQALAGGMAGLSTGLSVGNLFTSPGAAGVAGGAGGFVSGALATGTYAGGFIGLGVGAAAAIYSAQQNRRAQRAAMDQQRQSIIASMGGVDQFREAVERAGFSYEYFLSLFNSSDPDIFLDSVTRLNTALQEQATRASVLTKGLEEVARVQGVLSSQQIAQIRNMDPQGPGAAEVVAFAQQQRMQAEQGIGAAIAAIDAATAGGTQNMAEFQSSIDAVTASMVVLFDEAVRNGESAIQVLQRLADPIKQLQKILAAAGQSGGAGFGQLALDTEIATGPQTGPLVQLAQGLGQALAAFANTGLLSPELFQQLANGIGEAYHQLELLGKGGLEAARLMQPSLQTIWQMIQDNPALRDTLDETTRALLDFAEQNGLVGDKFRPAIDRMIKALDDLIKKLDEFIARMGQIPGMPQVPTPPGPTPAPPPPGPTPTPPIPPSDDGRPMAAGGIVTRATRALIGEAGPEAVIPLSRLGHFGPPIQITVVSQIDGYEAARAITRYQPDVYRTYGAA
jgi:hypothetical protein